MLYFLNFDVDPKFAPGRIESLGSGIPSDFIISRNQDGSIKSIFSDPIWDMRMYGAQGPFYFESWHRGEKDDLSQTLTHEIQTILWMAMFNPWIAKKGKKINSYNNVLTCLRTLAKMAYRIGTTLENAHLNPKFQAALKASAASVIEDGAERVQIQSLKIIIKCCHTAKHLKDSGYAFPYRIVSESEYDQWLVRLKVARNDLSDESKRTPLIPVRILANLISGIEKELENLRPHLDGFVSLFEAIYSDQKLWCDRDSNIRFNINRIKKSGRTWPNKSQNTNVILTKEETLQQFHLDEFLKSENISFNLQPICSYFKRAFEMARILLFIFTGMRASEQRVMPFDCYKELDIPNFGGVSFLFSHTTKMAQDNYSGIVQWVTAPIAKMAVEVAQKITRINWIRNTPKPFPADHKTVPLWLSSHRAKPCKNYTHYDFPIAPAPAFTVVLKNIDGIFIKQSDIDELVTFDAFRNWDEDPKFAVGKKWPFSSHQGRRSVAVYASRSGMVSLPSMGRQFKHVTLAMTALYSENSGFAESFILTEGGKVPEEYQVLSEFRDNQRLNASVAFEEHVIKSDTALLGGRGNEFQRQKEDNMPAFLDSAENMKDKIQTGQAHYTPLPQGGGCMRATGPCEKHGIDWTFPCFGCKDASYNGNALIEYSESMQDSFSEMDADSLAYKFTSEKLNRIEVVLLKKGG